MNISDLLEDILSSARMAGLEGLDIDKVRFSLQRIPINYKFNIKRNHPPAP